MPRPRLLTDAQEAAAFAEYQSAIGARGTIAALADKYGLTWPGMKQLLERVEHQIKVSRETSISADQVQP